MKNSKFKMSNYDDCIVVSSLRLGIIQARLGFCSRSASSVQNFLSTLRVPIVASQRGMTYF